MAWERVGEGVVVWGEASCNVPPQGLGRVVTCFHLPTGRGRQVEWAGHARGMPVYRRAGLGMQLAGQEGRHASCRNDQGLMRHSHRHAQYVAPSSASQICVALAVHSNGTQKTPIWRRPRGHQAASGVEYVELVAAHVQVAAGPHSNGHKDGGTVGGSVGRVAYCECRHILSTGCKLLDPVEAALCHVHKPCRVHSNAVGVLQAAAGPLGQELAGL